MKVSVNHFGDMFRL